jgi:hypothetical protein
MPFTPSRRIKMELFREPRFLSLDEKQRLLLLTLLHYTDALGREVASSTLLRELLYEFDKVTQAAIDRMLAHLEERAWLLLYERDRRRYMQINPTAFKAFVAIDVRDGSRHPPPDPGPVAAQGAAWGDPGPTAAEGKGEGGSPGEPTWLTDPDEMTPQGCPTHPSNTGTIPCGPCGAAGRTHKRLFAGEISKERALAEYLGSQQKTLTHEEALDLWRRRRRAEE